MATAKKAVKSVSSKAPNAGIIVGIAAGVAAVTAAGYFLFGPNGKNNRKVIKGWTVKMKGEVLEKIEKLKEVTPETYNAIIDDVSAKYAKVKNISEDDLAMVTADLKKYWKVIARDINAKNKTGKKKVATVKKAVTKEVKKTVKKVAKKVIKGVEEVAAHVDTL